MAHSKPVRRIAPTVGVLACSVFAYACGAGGDATGTGGDGVAGNGAAGAAGAGGATGAAGATGSCRRHGSGRRRSGRERRCRPGRRGRRHRGWQQRCRRCGGWRRYGRPRRRRGQRRACRRRWQRRARRCGGRRPGRRGGRRRRQRRKRRARRRGRSRRIGWARRRHRLRRRRLDVQNVHRQQRFTRAAGGSFSTTTSPRTGRRWNNRAIGGRTSRRFIEEGRLTTILSTMRGRATTSCPVRHQRQQQRTADLRRRRALLPGARHRLQDMDAVCTSTAPRAKNGDPGAGHAAAAQLLPQRRRVVQLFVRPPTPRR